MFKKNTLATAVRVALMLSAATLMHGCVGDGDETTNNTSKVGGTFSVVNAPKGTVMGVVQDTNGNPIVGATVYLGAKKQTTNAGGQYQFNDVAVVSTTSLDGVATQAIQISIIPPAGYLGATVTVTPQAQIDGMSDDADGGDATANQVTTFISGYTASAGTAVLPKLDATVQGTLRNNDTGEIIASHDVALDMVSVNSVAQEQQQNGVTTSYATIPYVTQSGADGNFTLTGVPNDSDLRFVVGGYSVVTVDANSSLSGVGVSTDDEVDEIVVGNVRASLITALDDIDPYVINVGHIAANNMLERDIDGTTGVTVYFSEVMADSADGSYEVVVYDDTNKKYVLVSNVTMAADHKSLTFTTSAPFESGAVLKVSIARGDLKDIAANNIDIGGSHPDKFGYDSVVASAIGTSYLRLELQAWGDTNINAPAVDTAAQQAVDTFGIDDVPEIQALNPAFNDVWDNDSSLVTIQQLNSADDDDGDLFSDAGTRLSALMTALNGGTTIDVQADNAQVTFTSTGATYYTFVGTRLNAPISLGVAILTPNMIDSGAVDADGNIKYVVTEEGQVAMVLTGVNPGDVMTITPYDDFDNAGTPFDVAFVDNVEPTTVLQNSYGLGSNSGADIDYGDGGELSHLASQQDGTPYLNVTMGLLDNINEGATDLGAPNDLNDELTKYNSADATTTLPYLDIDNLYDARAYTSFSSGTNLSRTIGVAFSEDIVLTGTPTFNGTTQLSNYAAHNDVNKNDASGITNADLVDVDVANVIALATTDHDKVINFSNVVADSAGNPGTVAKVQVRDVMPPMLVSAVYGGKQVTLTFNEDIAPKVGDKLYFMKSTFQPGNTAHYQANGQPQGIYVAEEINLSQATINGFNLVTHTNKKELVILMQDWLGDLLWDDQNAATSDGAFELTAYVEPSTSTDRPHGIFHYWNVADVQGNKMTPISNSVAGFNAGVVPVAFAMYNELDRLSFNNPTSTATTTGATSTDFTVSYTANHMIDLDASLSSPTGTYLTSLSGTQVDDLFSIVDDSSTDLGTINTTLSSASLSADGKTLTVHFVLTTALTNVDNIVMSKQLVSDYDKTQKSSAASIPM